MAHFLLLHGACHGGWCWDRVTPLLQPHPVTAPDLPCDDVNAGLNEYVECALAALGDDEEEIVVVGHSLGALVVPLVAQRVRTRRIVMLAGIIGAPGMSLERLAETDTDRDLPADPDVPFLEFDSAGRFRFTPEAARRSLFHDCEPQDAEWAIGQLRFQRSLWTEVADFDSWPDTEIVSITCTQDRVVNPAWSDRIATERLGVEPVHLASSH